MGGGEGKKEGEIHTWIYNPFGKNKMQNIWLSLFYFISASSLVRKSSDDYSSDYEVLDDDEYPDEQEENEKVVHRSPKFISPITDAIVNEGETIKINCIVDKLGKIFF